jgi:hypothetical protein
MKKLLLGALLLLSTLSFGQTYSGSVYIVWGSSVYPYYEEGANPQLLYYNNYKNTSNSLIPIEMSGSTIGQNIIYSNGSVDVGDYTFNKQQWTELIYLITNKSLSEISTDINNQTIINIGNYSDYLNNLNLSLYSWKPRTNYPYILGEMFTIHFNINSLSSNQNTLTELNLYPNPTTGDLYLSTNTDKNIKIYDMIGNLVFDKDITNFLDTSNLSTGVYLCEITEGENKLTKKIVKR